MSYLSDGDKIFSFDFKCTNDNYFAFFLPPRTSKETLRLRNSSTFNTKTSKWQKEYYKI